MFAVKKCSPLTQVAKILRAKICLRRIIRVTLPAVAKIKRAEIYHAKKKERENFPIYGMCNEPIKFPDRENWFMKCLKIEIHENISPPNFGTVPYDRTRDSFLKLNGRFR